MSTDRQATERGWSARTGWLVGGSLAVFVGTVLVFWRLNLFDRPDGESDVRILVAILALIGLLVSETVAIVGILIKDSVDQRLADLREIELGNTRVAEQRNHQLAEAEAQRNRTDVSIRAVELLSTAEGDGNPRRASGAIGALLSLGEIDLALILISEMWPDRKISDRSAFLVISRAFEDGPDRFKLHTTAAAVLHENIDRVFDPDDRHGSYTWPFRLWEHPRHLPTSVRMSIVWAAHRWLLAEVRDHQTPGAPVAAVVLYGALEDDDVVIRSWAYRALLAIQSYLTSRAVYVEGGTLDRSLIDEALASRADAVQDGTPTTQCGALNEEIVAILASISNSNGQSA